MPSGLATAVLDSDGGKSYIQSLENKKGLPISWVFVNVVIGKKNPDLELMCIRQKQKIFKIINRDCHTVSNTEH